MPIYQYRCRSCGHELEMRQSFEDDALTTCPSCGEEQLRRVISASGVIFKGSGWYIKDSRSERGRRTLSSSSSSKDDESSAKGDGGGDSGGEGGGEGGGDAGTSESSSGDAGEKKVAQGSDASSSTGSAAKDD